MVESEEFEAEGEVAAVAEERHLEDMGKIDEGHGVNPAGKGPVVPEFPEEAADQRTQRQGEVGCPVAPGRGLLESAVAQQPVERCGDQVGRHPDKGEEVAGEGQARVRGEEQGAGEQHQQTAGRGVRQRSAVGETANKGETGEPLCGDEDGGGMTVEKLTEARTAYSRSLNSSRPLYASSACAS